MVISNSVDWKRWHAITPSNTSTERILHETSLLTIIMSCEINQASLDILIGEVLNNSLSSGFFHDVRCGSNLRLIKCVKINGIYV